MSSHHRSLAFGSVGLVVIAWIAISLRLGLVPGRRGGICRSSEPFQFYGVIFGYTVIATVLIGAAVIFWLHPDLSLHPVVPPGLDE